ncbi:MAG: transglycosylase SLT domain-containing protein [Bacteroidales bacterium]
MGYCSKLIMALGVILCTLTVDAQNDTTTWKDTTIVTNFQQNLDQLIDQWYVKNALKENYTYSETSDSIVPEFSDSVYKARLNAIPAIMEMTYNPIVRNWIHVYTKKRRKNVEYMLGLTEYYFPLFEAELEKQGLPNELKYLAIIESALNPKAVSRVGATGLWQFMYATGRMYDLTTNSFIDERRDPRKSTIAATRFLKDLYDIFQDWTLVIAAYNCGPGNVSKAIRRTGGKRDFWDIYYFLPRETRGYVPAFIAATYTMHFHEEHNLYARPIDFPLATDTLTINQQVHFEQISEVLQIPIDELHALNPQYRGKIIPGSDKYPMTLTLPVLKTGDFITLQDSIYNYKDSLFFNKEEQVKKPQKSHYVHQVPSGMKKVYYTIKPGDNLGYIAEWYNTRASNIRYWNGIRGNMIRSGQKLAIYVPKGSVNRYKEINTLSFAQKQQRIGKVSTASEPLKRNENYVYYTIKSGDTLWEIARKYPGVSDSNLRQLNGISGRNLRPGQVIKIKPKS